jgi:hypothetical protein
MTDAFGINGSAWVAQGGLVRRDRQSLNREGKNMYQFLLQLALAWLLRRGGGSHA